LRSETPNNDETQIIEDHTSEGTAKLDKKIERQSKRKRETEKSKRKTESKRKKTNQIIGTYL
jgi:hypothetical protein